MSKYSFTLHYTTGKDFIKSVTLTFIERNVMFATFVVYVLLFTSECPMCALIYIGPLSEHGQPFVWALLACWGCGGLYDQHGGQVNDLHP